MPRIVKLPQKSVLIVHDESDKIFVPKGLN